MALIGLRGERSGAKPLYFDDDKEDIMNTISEIERRNFGGWHYHADEQVITYSCGDVVFYRIPIAHLNDGERDAYWDDRFQNSTVMDSFGYYGWQDICNCLHLNGLLN